MVENFTPRVLDKLGLGWDAVHAANPRAVLVRMPAFGLDGPWRDRPGFAQNIEQASGLAWVTGQPRRPAPHPARAVRPERRAARGDRPARRRSTEPRPRRARVAWSRCRCSTPRCRWRPRRSSSGRANGRLLERDGNRSPRAAPQGVYRCAGRRRLARAVGRDRRRSGRRSRRRCSAGPTSPTTPASRTSTAGGPRTTSSTTRSRRGRRRRTSRDAVDAARRRRRPGRGGARPAPHGPPPAVRGPGATTRSSTIRSTGSAADARPAVPGRRRRALGPDAGAHVRPAHRRGARASCSA